MMVVLVLVKDRFSTWWSWSLINAGAPLVLLFVRPTVIGLARIAWGSEWDKAV